MISLCVVDVELEGAAFVSLDQREEILGLVQDRVGPDDVIRELAEAGVLGRARGLDIEDVPHVLVGTLERAEADGDAEKALSPPQSTGSYEDFPDLKNDKFMKYYKYFYLGWRILTYYSRDKCLILTKLLQTKYILNYESTWDIKFFLLMRIVN